YFAVAIDELHEPDFRMMLHQMREAKVPSPRGGEGQLRIASHDFRAVSLGQIGTAVRGTRIDVDHDVGLVMQARQAARQPPAFVATNDHHADAVHEKSSGSRALITRAGTPTATEQGGTSRSTTALAPMMLSWPI